MTNFSIENFGCRATDADAAAIRRDLLAAGLSLASDPARADVVVLNTCTVTAAADAQTRETVRKIVRANPGARIVVTGCYAQRAPEEIAALDGVSWVVGNSQQHRIAAVVRGMLSSATPASADACEPECAASSDFIPLGHVNSGAMSLARGPAKILTGDIFAQASISVDAAGRNEGDRTRPILKIQDGCNHRCSYCVIPFVRGASRSLPPDAVITAVQNLIASGAKEIVLSGINLGAYGRDLAPRASLAKVLQRVLNETSLERLRFSSIEPQDVTEDFVAQAAASRRIARHFHIPLQSGSDRILRGMHRWYRSGHYAERVALIRRLLPDASIGADVIVGFPGETGEDFSATFEFIARLPLSYLHVFSFSERPGTAAETLDAPRVPGHVIRERARTLRALSDKKASEFRASQAGSVERVITLARGGENWTEALTGNYLKVRLAGGYAPNEWHDAVVPGNPGEIVAPLDREMAAPVACAAG
ncbi:MAG: tRNA (N(6)-L-threonylcarbamoyladenosine(37)-C(2))-methylthiotransferase MtaB [Candidatus Acidiferrales bacterium]